MRGFVELALSFPGHRGISVLRSQQVGWPQTKTSLTFTRPLSTFVAGVSAACSAATSTHWGHPPPDPRPGCGSTHIVDESLRREKDSDRPRTRALKNSVAWRHGSHYRNGKDGLTLRVGRQEIALGSSRLVSFREGPNVRQSFDGVRFAWRRGEWQVDGFATKPVQTKVGVFDDAWDHTRSFWEVYAFGPFHPLPKVKVDLYHLGIDRKRARFDQGIDRESRHSVGARIWGKNEW